MARLPDVLDSLDAEAKKVYDRIASKQGRIGGPFAPLMHHPPLAERVAAVGEYLRYDATLPGDIRELAIIIAARHVAQPYEWVAHAAIAIREGLPEEIVEQVRARRDLSTLPARYVRAARLVQHVLARESVPQALQDEGVSEVGESGMIELVVRAGYYQAIAAVLFASDVPLPKDTPPPF